MKRRRRRVPAARRVKSPVRRGAARPEGARKRKTPRAGRKHGTPPLRWNPNPEDVQRSVVKLVLSLIELVRKLMERQAIRRLEEQTLTPAEIENVGTALMKLEQTIRLIARRFKIDPHELNVDLGPLGKLH